MIKEPTISLDIILEYLAKEKSKNSDPNIVNYVIENEDLATAYLWALYTISELKYEKANCNLELFKLKVAASLNQHEGEKDAEPVYDVIETCKTCLECESNYAELSEKITKLTIDLNDMTTERDELQVKFNEANKPNEKIQYELDRLRQGLNTIKGELMLANKDVERLDTCLKIRESQMIEARLTPEPITEETIQKFEND